MLISLVYSPKMSHARSYTRYSLFADSLFGDATFVARYMSHVPIPISVQSHTYVSHSPNSHCPSHESSIAPELWMQMVSYAVQLTTAM
jgi:hypothetical protein